MIYWSNKQTQIIYLFPFPLARRTNTATVQTFSTSHYVMLQRRKTRIRAPRDSQRLTDSLPHYPARLLNNFETEMKVVGLGSLQQEQIALFSVMETFFATNQAPRKPITVLSCPGEVPLIWPLFSVTSFCF